MKDGYQLLSAYCAPGARAGARRVPGAAGDHAWLLAAKIQLRGDGSSDAGGTAGTATAFAPFTPTRRGPTEAGTAERERIQPFVREAPRGPGGRAGDSGAVPGDATRGATRGNNTHTAKVRRLGGWPQVTSVPHLQEGAGPCSGRNASREGGSCLWGCSSWGTTRGLRRPAPPGLPGPATAADSRGGSYSHRERPGLQDGGGGAKGGGNWPRAADPAGRRQSTESPRAAGDLLTLVTPRPSVQPACGHFWGVVCLQGDEEEGQWQDEGRERVPAARGNRPLAAPSPTTVLRNRGAPAGPPVPGWELEAGRGCWTAGGPPRPGLR